jgi:hypothetical protein
MRPGAGGIAIEFRSIVESPERTSLDDFRLEGMKMDKDESVGEAGLPNSNIPDDVLERAAAGTIDAAAAWTINCTYDYYQCGPIGIRPASGTDTRPTAA